MKYWLPVCLFLFLSSCVREHEDTEAIVGIFDRHSYAVVDPDRLRTALKRGAYGLMGIDGSASIIVPGSGGEDAVELDSFAGIVAEKRAGGLYVVKIFEGSPAAEAGLKEGDRIASINSRDVAYCSDKNILEGLSGSRGKKAAISFVSGGRESAAGLAFTQDSMPNVWGFIASGDIGYVRIMYFSAVSDQLKALLTYFKASGVKKVVLDVRDNYGGSLEDMAGALRFFIGGQKLLFRVVSRHKEYTRDYYAGAQAPFPGMKIVVLVNRYTMSRAEVFAQSLRELAGALVAGEDTAGDISVTKVFSLSKGKGLRLTIAKLQPPSGKSLELVGAMPNVRVPAVRSERSLLAYPSRLLNADVAYVSAMQILSQP